MRITILLFQIIEKTENLVLGMQVGDTEMMGWISKRIMTSIIVTVNILALPIKENGFLIQLKFLKQEHTRLSPELLLKKQVVNFIYR